MSDNLKKVLVTGGCGFIGTHLCRDLLTRGAHVVAIDNLSCGDRVRISALEESSNFKFYEGDICDVSTVENIFLKEKPSAVVHLAAKISIKESLVKPELYFGTNVFGTFIVAEIASKYNVSKFLYVNSASSYGKTSRVPTSESEICCPNNPYSMSKLLGEQVALNFGTLGNMAVISVRLFNLYGIGAGALFGLFLEQHRKSKPLTITGSGTQRRDFTYVGDVSNSICELLDSEIKNEIFNVATGETQSIIELAEAMGGEWEFIKRDSDEPDLMWADISKLRRMLPSAVPSSPFNETVKAVMKNLL